MFHAKTLLQKHFFYGTLIYMAKIIAFSNQKGGVGKTTTCVNLAAYIALMGKRVLVVDLDSQGNASSSLGYFDKNLQKSTYAVLCGGEDIKNCLRNTDIDGLKILPSSKDMAGAEVELARMVEEREHVLEKRLSLVCDDFDFIFIDQPPSIGLVAVNALAAASGIIVPLVCEYFALEGLAGMMNTVKLVRKFLNPNTNIAGVVLEMYDARSKLTREVRAEIEKLFGDKVFATTIPKNIRLAEAPSFGKPIALYDKKCAGAVAYEALAQEFIQKI